MRRKRVWLLLTTIPTFRARVMATATLRHRYGHRYGYGRGYGYGHRYGYGHGYGYGYHHGYAHPDYRGTAPRYASGERGYVHPHHYGYGSTGYGHRYGHPHRPDGMRNY